MDTPTQEEIDDNVAEVHQGKSWDDLPEGAKRRVNVGLGLGRTAHHEPREPLES